MTAPMTYNDNCTDGNGGPTTTMDPSDPSQPEITALFEYINSYPFCSDAEFRSGLAVILGHPDTPASETEVSSDEDLVLQAKCFYISRKKNIAPPLSFSAYKNWFKSATGRSHPSEPQSPGYVNQPATTMSSEVAKSSSPSPTSGNQKQAPEPAYPSSFAHIVELITTGQPVPGIQQIPDTVLAGHEAPSRVMRRRKPWEEDDREKGDDEK